VAGIIRFALDADTPAGFMHHIEVVSRLGGAHLDQLPELIEASTCVDGHEPLGEHKFLRLQQGDDLATGLLAYEDGALAGYAHTLAYGEGEDRRVSCELVVHPSQRGRGVGRLLLAEAVERASSHGARRIDVWAYNDSRASARIAHAAGFTASRRLLHLHRHLSTTPDVRPDKGAAIRAYRPWLDDEAWLALNNRIFRAHPENGSWTLDDLRARMAQPWFCAEDFLVLDVQGVMAGFCWLKVEERRDEGRVGEIYVIGTAPEHQGRGYGRRLVGEALAHLRRRGVRTAAIYVDEANAPAVALYERSGFHYHHVDVCYSRELPVAGERTPAADEVAA
jgi:mycothiol synthase